MKTWPRFGQWPLARASRKWLNKSSEYQKETALWITYPFYTELAKQLKPTSLIYYNLDDYRFYWPDQVHAVEQAEANAVAMADWTVCVSLYRKEELKKTYPSHAHRIVHLPHAAPEWTIPASPHFAPQPLPEILSGIPRPILGYIGGLEDRLDWDLIEKVSEKFSDCSIVLVGPKPGGSAEEPLRKKTEAVLSRPNVYAPGPVKQGLIASVYASFDVNLIPYQTENPFNRACSPTKLLDAMGSGRPTVATSLPECRLYHKLYDIAETHDQFLKALNRLKNQNFCDGRQKQRWEYAISRRSSVVLDALFRLNACKCLEDARLVLETVVPIG